MIRANCRMPPKHGAAKWLRKAGTAGNRDDGAAIAVGPDRRNRHAGEQQREEEQAHGPQDRLIDAGGTPTRAVCRRGRARGSFALLACVARGLGSRTGQRPRRVLEHLVEIEGRTLADVLEMRIEPGTRPAAPALE